MASMLTNLATEDCLSARQVIKLFISISEYMKYNQSMRHEHRHAVYQWKENQISNSVVIIVLDFIAATVFEIKNIL